MTSFNLADAGVLSDLIQSILTSMAILLGGAWTYFHFFKGRSYHTKLDPEIRMHLNKGKNSYWLLVDTSVRNLGLSEVGIDLNASALVLHEIAEIDPGEDALTARHKEVAVFDVLEKHHWIEGGESVGDQRIIVVSRRSQAAFQARLRIVSRRRTLGWRTYEWNAVCTAFTDLTST